MAYNRGLLRTVLKNPSCSEKVVDKGQKVCYNIDTINQTEAVMLQITINQGDGTPIYFQLVRQIKHLIATGRLIPGDELPAVRVLAQQLVINPNTVVRAYRELETAGLVVSRRGSGTYISEGPVPYSNGERRRLLSEQVDSLVVESRGLGFSLGEVIELVGERDRALRVEQKPKEDKSHGTE